MRGGLRYHPPPADPHVAADRERPGSVRSFVRRGPEWSPTGGTSPSGGTTRVDDDDRRTPAGGLRLGCRGVSSPVVESFRAMVVVGSTNPVLLGRAFALVAQFLRRRGRNTTSPSTGRRGVLNRPPASDASTALKSHSRRALPTCRVSRGWPTDNLRPGPLHRGPPDRARTRSGSTCSASSRTTCSPARKRGQDGRDVDTPRVPLCSCRFGPTRRMRNYRSGPTIVNLRTRSRIGRVWSRTWPILCAAWPTERLCSPDRANGRAAPPDRHGGP